jgi:SAM-dependent methyltransferase
LATESDLYWQTGADDEAMQDQHGFMWQAMLDTIDLEPRGARVLDAGCNRGGFLRLLCDRGGIEAGFGYDPAAGAIDDARRLAGDRPLTFEVADTVPPGWDGLDLAFSHEVLYLLHDLAPHAQTIHEALRAGGVYYAVNGVHAGAPMMVEWHGRNAERLGLPPLYSLDDLIEAFTEAGFETSVARLKMGFVPVSQDHASSFPASLEYFYDQKAMLRFAKASG